MKARKDAGLNICRMRTLWLLLIAATSLYGTQLSCPPNPPDLAHLGTFEELKSKGFAFTCSYYIELAANPIGGEHRGFGNAGSLGLSAEIDLDKLANLSGLSFFTSICFRSGVNLSARKIDNQFEVTQLYGGETVRLSEVYFKESLLNANLEFKAGRLTAGNDFLSSPYYCQYLNLAFCGNPIAILLNSPFLDYPFSTWGAYLDFKPHPDLLVKFAVYNNNPNVKRNKYHGLYWTFKSTEGVSWLSEWHYKVHQTPRSRGYPGNYKIGGYYLTGSWKQFEGGSQTGNYGAYFLFDQLLQRKYGPKTTQGLSVFGVVLLAPKNRNLFPLFLSGGLQYKGLIAQRDDDYLSVGVAYGQYSQELREMQRQAAAQNSPSAYGNRPQNFETIVELSYWYRFNRWAAITPDVQYVINPKGYGTTPNALVFAVQLSFDFIGLPDQP